MEVSLHVGKGQFVSWFVLAILVASFLDGIVGEVDVLIIYFLEGPFETGCSYIALLIPIAFDFAVDNCDHHEDTDIEFPRVIE